MVRSTAPRKAVLATATTSFLSSFRLSWKSQGDLVIHISVLFAAVLLSKFDAVAASGDSISGNDNNRDVDEISVILHPRVTAGSSGPVSTRGTKIRFPDVETTEDAAVEGNSKSKYVDNSSSAAVGGHGNVISDYIKNGELSAIFCERCSETQKEKVEQILYLLYNLSNPSVGEDVITSSEDFKVKSRLNSSAVHELSSYDKNYILMKKKNVPKAFKRTTSSPVVPPYFRKNLPEMIPTPDSILSPSSPHYFNQRLHPRDFTRVIQLPPPTLSTTTPVTSSSAAGGYSSMAIPIVPYFYPSPTSTSPIPSFPTTVSSALEPAQSVEMPTPPMPPTTTGPVYLYYLGGSGSNNKNKGPSSAAAPASSLSSSGSLEPPTTPVMESSVGYASRPTTIEPML